MARNFNGTSDKILMSLGAIPSTLAGFTLAAIVRVNSTGNWHNILTLASSADVTIVDMTINNSDQLYVEPGNQATVTGISTGWQLLALGKLTGTNVFRGHRYIYSTNAWTHTNSGSTSADPSGTVARPYIGTFASGDFFDGDIAVAAMFDRGLTDAEVENLPFTLQAWLALAPKALWVFDQSATGQKIKDIVGGANESTLTGTTVAAASAPVFNYTDGIWLPTAPTAGGPTTYQKTGDVVAGTTLAGADAREAVETGAVATEAIQSGADVHEAVETGSLAAAGLLSGADVFEHGELGALIAGTFASGADARTAAETGALTAGGLLSGASAKVGAGKDGTIAAGASLSGTDAFAASEAGSIAAGALVSGADARERRETGTISPLALLAGADAAVHAETGALLTGALLAGVDGHQAARVGAILAGVLLAGPKIIGGQDVPAAVTLDDGTVATVSFTDTGLAVVTMTDAQLAAVTLIQTPP